jgi:hypothetical protein
MLSDTEYKRIEGSRFFRQIEEIEKSPLNDRIEGYNNLLEYCQLYPNIIAERIQWLLNGSYGKGSYDRAWYIIHNTKNPIPELFHIISHLEWMTSSYYASKAYKKLTQAEKDKLNTLINAEIEYMNAEVA